MAWSITYPRMRVYGLTGSFGSQPANSFFHATPPLGCSNSRYSYRPVSSKTGTLKGAACEGGLIGSRNAAWSLVVMTKECTAERTGSVGTGDLFIAEVSRDVFEAWHA